MRFCENIICLMPPNPTVTHFSSTPTLLNVHLFCIHRSSSSCKSFFWGGRPRGFVTVSLVWYLPHSHLFRSFLSLSQKHLLFNFGRMVEDLFFLQKGIAFRFWSATCFGFRNRFSASLVWLDSFSKQLPYIEVVSVRCGTFLAKSANIVFQASVFSYSGLPLCIRS